MFSRDAPGKISMVAIALVMADCMLADIEIALARAPGWPGTGTAATRWAHGCTRQSVTVCRPSGKDEAGNDIESD